MPSQTRITIAGLGAGSPADLTLGALEALRASSRTLLRTGKHPAVEWLQQEGISFTTFDHFYEEEPGFQEVYRRIAAVVLEEARSGPVLYAVPGHPLVAEESVHLVLARAEQEGIEVELLPAVSFLDALCSALRLDPGLGLQLVDGLRLDAGAVNPAAAAVITQVYSRLTASDIKLKLMEVYPAEHPVTVVRGAGLPGGERVEVRPLFELDRLDWLDHLTSVYLPAVGQGKRDVRSGKWDMGSGIRDAEGSEVEGAGNRAGQALQDDPEPGVEVIQVYEAEEAGPGEAEEEHQIKLVSKQCQFPLDPLVRILARLRGEGGCPWDREQDHRSLRPYLLEEAYEVLEALDEGDMYKICEELGDLLLQIVFHAQIAAENKRFDLNDVVAGISEKMIRRHPHVFGSVTAKDSQEVKRNWEMIKESEKKGCRRKGILSGVSMSLPALTRAARLQKKAAGVGFDWPDYRGALEKIHEELGELESVISGGDSESVESEMGDLLFSVVNLARLLGVEPEVALSGTSAKFIRRFSHVEEKAMLLGRDPAQCTLVELDEWWEEAKLKEAKEEKKEKI